MNSLSESVADGNSYEGKKSILKLSNDIDLSDNKEFSSLIGYWDSLKSKR